MAKEVDYDIIWSFGGHLDDIKSNMAAKITAKMPKTQNDTTKLYKSGVNAVERWCSIDATVYTCPLHSFVN